jgi:hypothetical protein
MRAYGRYPQGGTRHDGGRRSIGTGSFPHRPRALGQGDTISQRAERKGFDERPAQSTGPQRMIGAFSRTSAEWSALTDPGGSAFDGKTS